MAEKLRSQFFEINFGKLFDRRGEPIVASNIIEDLTGIILMTGFMNLQAYVRTVETGVVTFYSRSSGKLWIKGETSGNFLIAKRIISDCDNDTLLIYSNARGPVCHRGTQTCFDNNRS